MGEARDAGVGGRGVDGVGCMNIYGRCWMGCKVLSDS